LAVDIWWCSGSLVVLHYAHNTTNQPLSRVVNVRDGFKAEIKRKIGVTEVLFWI